MNTSASLRAVTSATEKVRHEVGDLLLAIAASVMPAVLALVTGAGLPLPGSERTDFSHDLEALSLVTAVVLIGVYAGGLVFSLKTHRDIFNPSAKPEPVGKDKKAKKGAARSGNPAKRAIAEQSQGDADVAAATDLTGAVPDDFSLPAEFTDLLHPPNR